MQLEVNAEIAKTIKKKKWGLLVFKMVEFIRNVLDVFFVGTAQVFNPHINSVLNKFKLINNLNNLV